MEQKQIIIGRTINHRKMVGFKLSFPDKKTANHYKEMMGFILENDGFKIIEKRGYYDKNEN